MIIVVIIVPCNIFAEEYIEIMVPNEHISTKRTNLCIVGRTSSPCLTITLNNVPIADIQVKDSIFHHVVYFTYGLNEITLTPCSEDNTGAGKNSVTMEIMSAPQIQRTYRKLYPDYVFHDSQTRTECTVCHAGAYQKLTDISEEETCLDCHRHINKKFVKHTTADDRVCVNCHRFGARPGSEYYGGDASRNPCFFCHKDIIGAFSQDYIHGPVAGGSCTICHNPHGSNYEKSLVSPLPILCFSCHEDIEDELELSNVHSPFKTGNCTKCHDPHSTSNRWVLTQNSEKVCLTCHLEQGTLQSHEHPYNVKPKRLLQAELKLTSKGKLECLSCHNPHSTNSPHLLRTEQEFTCLGCHENKL